jgi:hypothetical protein
MLGNSGEGTWISERWRMIDALYWDRASFSADPHERDLKGIFPLFRSYCQPESIFRLKLLISHKDREAASKTH